MDVPSSATGAGGVVQLAVALTGLLSLVDDGLRWAGALVLLVALLFAALYGHSRESHLAIRVAGGDQVRVPATAADAAAADRLRVAVEKASKPSAG